MQLFWQRHSFGDVDVQRWRHKAIPTAVCFQTVMWFHTAMGSQ
jgi:hypothetical protein